MSQEIVRRAEAGVSTISFNRVERKNSINGVICAALAEALSAARVAVLQGSGRPFHYRLAVETA
jgi:enoyl-CoA hydratase/carnithine racemase